MTRASRAAVAVVIMAAVTPLAGCSLISPGGPAVFGGEGGATLCVPVARGDQVLLGQVLTAPAGAGIEIVDISLDTPDGVSLEGAYNMPIDTAAGDYGIGSATVPPEDPPSGWKDRVDAVGSVVDKGDSTGIVVRVEHTGAGDAEFAAVHLAYRADGIQYEKSATTLYQLRDSCF